MPSLPPSAPERWASDDVTAFIDAARVNEYATFANLPAQMSRLIGIDRAFRKVIDAFNNSKDWFPGLFVLRAHSNYLGACRLTLSGQLPESYALLRSTLENALYGLYLSRNPASRETWLRREDDTKSKQKVRNEFTIGALLKLATQIAPSEGKVAKTMYERAIAQGAHPNELALMQTLKLGKQPAHLKFTVSYLQGDGLPLQLALKSTAQVGVCTLALFERVMPERYAILGINQDVASLQAGL